ncbi:unnamed protein product [Chironomus riparius]|uniref:Enhancer of rudimentary homolog n=1 Tax=Chironomus riparius TaxID=315576 RepID=A0A9N9RRN6_9DIPT|nr:unnamed protein product [Chironomus riparius]
MVHLILLIQFSSNPKSKHYYDFESIPDAVKHICTLYEEKLKKINQKVPYITYDIMNLYQYVDELQDCSMLVDRGDGRNYIAYPKLWVKQKIFHILRHEVPE